MRLAGAELLDSREILPGQWLQTYHAPELVAGARAGQFVHVRTGDYSGLVLRRPFSFNTIDPVRGHPDDPFPDRRARHRMVHPAPAGRPDRHARPARPAVRGRFSRTPARAARRRRARDRGRPLARRRGDPRRPPGHPAVRRRERARRLPVVAAARRGRIRGRDRRRLGRPSRLRDRARPGVRGLGRPGLRLRPAADAPRPGVAGGVARRGRLGVAKLGRKRGGGKARARRLAARRRRRSSRSRWSRTWAARSGRASAASCWRRPARRSASVARARSSPPTSSTGRAAGEGEAPRRHDGVRGAPGPRQAPPDRAPDQVGDRAGRPPARRRAGHGSSTGSAAGHRFG